MTIPKLHQTVAVFDDTQSPGDGGMLGLSGVVIGIDRKHHRCSIELTNTRQVVDVPFDEVTIFDVGSTGVISDDGESARGVYRTRTGHVVTFTIHNTNRTTTHFELRKPLQSDRPPYTRIHVEVPRDYELTRDSIKYVLGQILAKRGHD